MERKKRILIIADSIKRMTGYATVATNIIARLSEKYDIAQLGLADVPLPVKYNIDYYSMTKIHKKCCGRDKVIEYVPKGQTKIQYLKMDKGVPLHENQSPCIKGGNDNNDNYGYLSVYFVVQHFKPDIVVPINDVWGLYNICHLRNRRCFKLVPYMAIDSECMFPQIMVPNPQVKLPPVDAVATISDADRTVLFTNWAHKVVNRTARILKGRDLDRMTTIPHGVDNRLWRPLDNKEELREKYFGIKDTPNKKIFLIGSVARNQPRKRLDGAIQTLRLLMDKYEGKGNVEYRLYFHCAIEDRLGWPLPWLARWYEVDKRVVFDKNLRPGAGPSTEMLNEIVNCFDAHISLTNSEGWHLPALETIAAGIPNIITNYSAHADWGKDALMLCKVAAIEHEPRTGFIKAIADVNDAAKKIHLLASSPKFKEEWVKKGLKLANKLDWDNVCVKWDELFDSIDVSDLAPNRYEDPVMMDPQIQDFSLKYFPKEEDRYNPDAQKQL